MDSSRRRFLALAGLAPLALAATHERDDGRMIGLADVAGDLRIGPTLAPQVDRDIPTGGDDLALARLAQDVVDLHPVPVANLKDDLADALARRLR